jgi:hypothetical protein
MTISAHRSISMRTHQAVATAAALSLAAAGLASLSSPAQARRAAEWVPMSSSWPGRQAVAVSDVVAFGKVSFVVGTSSKDGANTPWVQKCSGRSCSAARLPRPGGHSATVMSISGSARDDMWAVGFRAAPGGERRPVFWHKGAGSWSVFDSTIDDGVNNNIWLSQVEVSNKSKAFALGRQQFGTKDHVTSTLYRWNGTGWKEIAPVLERPSSFPSPCDGWYNRRWADVIARPGSAILFGTCGRLHKLAILEQGTTNWHLMSGDNLPTGVRWQVGAMVGQQPWLIGTRNGNRLIVANDGTGWKRVTVQGIRPKAVISDLAGPFASKVTAVGWIPTGGHHRVARAWHWGAGSWHESEVPAGISRSFLTAVSVDGSGPFFAVGDDLGRKPHLRAIIIHSVA